MRSIDASRYEEGKAYIAIEHHQVGDFAARAYKTDDYGESWTQITQGVDDGVLSYTRSIHEDPVRPGLLYLGTEASVYFSLDDGESWSSLHTNMPHTPMYGLVVQEHFNDLVVGTYGRGYWILDDVTPLQQMTTDIEASAAHLFSPRAAYRFRPISGQYTMFEVGYQQHQAGLLDEAVWATVLEGAAGLLSLPHVRAWWTHRRRVFTEEFVQAVEDAPAPASGSHVNSNEVIDAMLEALEDPE